MRKHSLMICVLLVAAIMSATAGDVRRWDFTQWSAATVRNLKADAAGWSDIEKASATEPTNLSAGNCYWEVTAQGSTEGTTLQANGQPIAELEGLLYTNVRNRSLAIAVNYGDLTSTGTDFAPYHGPSYLWLGGKQQNYLVIPRVPAGATISIGVESHKVTDARGVQLFLGHGNTGTQLKDSEGKDVPTVTVYTEQEWVVPTDAADAKNSDGTYDVQIRNTNGCHIYYIEVNDADTTDNPKINGIYYNLNSKTKQAEVTSGGTKYTGCVNIPETLPYNGINYRVVSIGYDAFSDCKELTSITIPNSVTSIGEYAFYKCSGLTSVTIPNSVVYIGNGAFSNCSNLTSFTIPNGVSVIEYHTFYGCKGMTSVTIPNSVIEIKEEAFYDCSGLTTVELNSDVIASMTYSSGHSLKDIFGAQVSEYFLGDSVTKIGDCAFYGCSSLTSVNIPNSVTSIGDKVFYDCSGLTSVTIGSSVTSIGGSAFNGCSSLTSVTIPDGVTSIGDNAFNGCSSLTSVTIPDGVTSIGYRAFYNCSSLTSVPIPNSVDYIGNGAFSGCSSLTSVTIPNGVDYIGIIAFNGCSSLTSVTIPNSVKTIGNSAFSGCSSLTSVTIPNSVTFIHSFAFQGCSSLTSVTIPDGVVEIGVQAFYDCSGLTTVELNSDVIASMARSSDYSLKDIFGAQVPEYILGNSVTKIGDCAFYGCSGLTSLKIGSGVTSIGDKAFYGCNAITKVELNSNAIVSNAYAPDSGIYVFFGEQVKEYILGNSVTSIGERAFIFSRNLMSVTISDSVTSIGDMAFCNCSSLTSVTIPNSVESIGFTAFNGCSSLTSVKIGSGVTSMGNLAFWDCYNLTSVIISNGVTEIGERAFYGCSSLKNVTIPNSVTTIKDGAFTGCSRLKVVRMGNSVTSIGESAFYECSSLTSVNIPNSVTSIGESAFKNCRSLTKVYCYAEKVPSTGNNVFYGVNVENATLHVPETSVSAYKTTDPWRMFGTIVALDPSDIDLSRYTLVKDLNLGSYGNAYNQYNLITIDPNDQRGTAWNHSNKNYPKIYNTLTPEDWHDVLAFQAVYPGSDNKGWFIYKDQGIYSKSADRSAAVLNRKAGDIIVFETTKASIEDVMTLTNGNGDPDGPFAYQKSSDGKKYYVTMTGYGQVGFCSYHNDYPFITRITIYELNAEPISVRACDLTMEYGDEVPALTWTATQDGQPVSISGEPYLHTEATRDSKPGNYTIYCEPGSVTTAGVVFVNGTLTITSHTQGDVNGDTVVDVADIATVISVMAAVGSDPVSARNADVNHDGVVDVADIATVISIMAGKGDDQPSTGHAPKDAVAVDLGLPSGTKWANMNVGAERPEDYGLFFAWGETTGYTSDTSDGHLFDWTTYKWMNEGQSDWLQINKYQVEDGYTDACWYDSNGNFIGDGKNDLDISDDAARANWGGQWVMPTYEDMWELFDNTIINWTTENGVYGCRFTSNVNDNFIFLPAAGIHDGGSLYDLSAGGYYWSASVCPSDSCGALLLYFESGSTYPDIIYRYVGLSVRPVLRN